MEILIILVLSLAQFISAGDNCPSVVSRSTWGAKAPVRKAGFRPAVGYVIIHHTGSDYCTSFEECSRAARRIQKLHQNHRKWSDIGYNFLIGGDGKIYEGRGWKQLGAHASGFNSRSVGIAFLGDFSKENPSKAMVNSASKLIACGVAKGYISSRYHLLGHKHEAPKCPRDHLHELIRSWPHYKESIH